MSFICPLCNNATINGANSCFQCGINYWPSNDIKCEAEIEKRIAKREGDFPLLWVPINDGKDYYWHVDHDRFYSVDEMNRLVKMKAFI